MDLPTYGEDRPHGTEPYRDDRHFTLQTAASTSASSSALTTAEQTPPSQAARQRVPSMDPDTLQGGAGTVQEDQFNLYSV